MEQRVRDEVVRLVEECSILFGVPIQTPHVSFTVKGATAGTAQRDGTRINFNMAILEAQPEAFIARTVPHEVAHAVLGQIHGARGVQPHGREWKALMINLGASPERCHSYDMTNVKVKRQRRWTYACACTQYELTTVRHNKIQRGECAYRCRVCRHKLTKGELKS